MERKAKELVERLKRNGITRFLLLFRGSRSRSELVATFMRCWSCAGTISSG